MSQAAISRQVRELETQLGVRLFERMAQGVRLTFAGAELLASLSRAFDTIETSLQSVSDNHRQSGLSLSVEPGFATCWLLPRLSGFQAANPDVEMMVETEDRSIEFRSHEPVLAIRFSATQSSWKNTEARHILRLTMIPVWSPHLPGADRPPAQSGRPHPLSFAARNRCARLALLVFEDGGSLRRPRPWTTLRSSGTDPAGRLERTGRGAGGRDLREAVSRQGRAEDGLCKPGGTRRLLAGRTKFFRTPAGGTDLCRLAGRRAEIRLTIPQPVSIPERFVR